MLDEQRLSSRLAVQKGVREKYFRRLGYENVDAAPAQVAKIALNALEMAREAASPKAVYVKREIVSVRKDGFGAKDFPISSPLWAGLVGKMTPPRWLAAFALTLGPLLDARTRELQEKSVALGFFMHEAGAQLAEITADLVQEMIAGDPDFDNLLMTRRFSPGYCDWPTLGQKDLFAVVKPEAIGIEATSAWMMKPSKSITAAMVFAASRPAASPCRFCNNKSCDHRRP